MQPVATKRDVIERFYIGQGIAERETATLASYFFQTTQWNRIFSGDVDIILGSKGAGKSAIYFLIKQREQELRDRGVYLVTAENPQGEPVFRQVSKTPPTDETSFMFLWKLYFLAIIVKRLDDEPGLRSSIREIKSTLQDEGLLPSSFSLARTLKAVLDYLKSRINFTALETGMEIDQTTGIPKKFTGKISFDTPSEKERSLGMNSVDELLKRLDDVLTSAKFRMWIVIDRLDVVFDQDREVEKRALRSLFRVYNDFFGLNNVHLKIFLRDDIWNTISEGGFREASHFVKRIDLSWTKNSLVHMVVRRLLASEVVVSCFGIDVNQMLSSFERQVVFFNSLFPDQMPIFHGVKKNAIDWIMLNTKDGNGSSTPREIIELLNFAREHEMSRIERGEPLARANILFSHESLVAGIRKVSKYKLEQTIFSEHPDLKKYINALYNRKRPRFSISDLMDMWEADRSEAQNFAGKLSEVGFFRIDSSHSYIVPHFYGWGLGIVSKSAADDIKRVDASEEASSGKTLPPSLMSDRKPRKAK
jgi:hypothetical protein